MSAESPPSYEEWLAGVAPAHGDALVEYQRRFDSELSTPTPAAQRVAEAARDLCAELCEDSSDVPQMQLKALHAALDKWEGIAPAHRHCGLPCGYDCNHPDGCIVSGPPTSAAQSGADEGESYGPVIEPTIHPPHWLDGEEVVARDLAMGRSERKARFITLWDHPFRVRANHPYYAQPRADEGEVREAIARVIDPDEWALDDLAKAKGFRALFINASLAKADAVLALASRPPEPTNEALVGALEAAEVAMTAQLLELNETWGDEEGDEPPLIDALVKVRAARAMIAAASAPQGEGK